MRRLLIPIDTVIAMVNADDAIEAIRIAIGPSFANGC